MKFLLTVAIASLTVLMANPPRPTMLLVVDDDPADRWLAEYYLRDFNCVTVTAGTAQQGLARLKDDWFDFAFVDLWLNGMTGLEFVRQAKPRNERIEFYIMSGAWDGSVGSKALTEAMLLNAQPIVKGGLPGSDKRMKSFAQTIKLILQPKEVG